MYTLHVKVSALTFTLLPGTNSYAKFLGLLRIFLKNYYLQPLKRIKIYLFLCD